MVALACQVVTGVALLAGTWFNWLGLYSTIGIIWIFLGTQGFAFPNTSALALSPFTRNAGSASALMGAVQLGVGAFVTSLVGIMDNDTAIPMAFFMCACAVLSFVVLLIGRHFISKESDEHIRGMIHSGIGFKD